MSGWRRPSRATILVVGLALGAFVLLWATAGYLPSGNALGPRLSIYSNRDAGARALYVWLRELGHQVDSIEYRPFALGREQLLFALAPSETYEQAEVDQIVRWIEAGGTLVHVADYQNKLLDRLGLRLARVSGGVDDALAGQPLGGVGAGQLGQSHATQQIENADASWVRLVVGASGAPTLGVAQARGHGRVYVFTTPGLLANGGLRSGENRALAAHLVAELPTGAAVSFDEYHHGLTERGTLMRRLFAEPWGWATLYVMAMGFGYAVLAGRRFGPALPPIALATARSRGEYVRTIGALLRQGRHRDWLREQYLRQLKRSLGERHHVPADLPSGRFVAALAESVPGAAALAPTLATLENPRLDDRGLVVAMRAAEEGRHRLLGESRWRETP